MRLIIILIALLTSQAHADQLIIEPDMGIAPIINAIQNAKKSIKLVMYGFTHPAIANALIKQKQQGREVKVILEKHPYKAARENHRVSKKFKSQHIAFKSGAYTLTHQKSMIIDSDKAIIMTFNFTRSSFNKERNFALILDDPAEIKQLDKLFTADWNRTPYNVTAANLIISPDNSREKILAFMHKTQQSLKIYAQTIKDYQILHALTQLSHHGVTIQILSSKKYPKQQEQYLLRAGIKIHYVRHKYIHAKVLIRDNDEVMIGSINLSHAGLSENRELAAITNNKTIVTQLKRVFAADWHD